MSGKLHYLFLTITLKRDLNNTFKHNLSLTSNEGMDEWIHPNMKSIFLIF